jgi:hypothetical protein
VSQIFLIKSIKHTAGDLVCWWGPNDRGYTHFVDFAGRYTEDQVKSRQHYYDNGESTRAVPLSEVIAESMRVVITKECGMKIGNPVHCRDSQLWEQRDLTREPV